MTLPIYLINLPQDSQRRAHMAEQLEGLGLAQGLIAVEATYGKHLSPSQRDAYYQEALNQRQYHLPLSPGEIGCYVSHLRVWEMVAAQNEPALVLEDDVVLHPSLPSALQEVADLPEPDWDMIKLIGRQRERPSQQWALEAPWQLVRYRRIPSMTAAYLISPEGARKLLASRKPFGRPVDVDLRYWWESDLNLYGMQPYPVALDVSSETSSIGTRPATRGWQHRWHKARIQIAYSWSAWIHQWRLHKRMPFNIQAWE